MKVILLSMNLMSTQYEWKGHLQLEIGPYGLLHPTSIMKMIKVGFQVKQVATCAQREISGGT